MKTIKLIDLLVKIANGEEVPKKIKYVNSISIYELTESCFKYDYRNEDDDLFEDTIVLENLNEEIEIIEDTPKEDKKIEKIGLPVPSLSPQILFLATKINKIIDRLNGEDNDK